MAHEIVDWDGISPEKWIRFSDKRFAELCREAEMNSKTTSIAGMTIHERTSSYVRMDVMLNCADGRARLMTFDLDRADYECSIINSPDFWKRTEFSDDEEYGWSACERNYGINHLGSKDPCPLRQLAFAILRGDGIALDAARDILKV